MVKDKPHTTDKDTANGKPQYVYTKTMTNGDQLEYETHQKATSEHDSLPSIHSPDGGYGWVVVISCFFLQGMLDGTFSVFGVFLPQLVSYYNVSHGKTAIIGSLLSACMMLSGPFVSVLIGFIGCQKVAMLGAICLTSGLALSTLAPNIDVVIVTFGLMGGIGLGLIFQPAVVMVGFWFERRRAIAMGISSSGAGCGMLLMAFLSGTFLKEYDWKNSLLMVSCVVLQGVVFSALLRPVHYRSTKSNKFEHNRTETFIALNNEKETIYNGHSYTSMTPSNGDVKHTVENGYLDKPKQLTKLLKESGKYNSLEDMNKKNKHSLTSRNGLYLSYPEIPSHRRNNSESKSQEFYKVNPLLRKDIFYSGSIQNIASNEPKKKIYISSGTSTLGKESASNFTPMKEMLSLHILKDKTFLIIALANSLMQAGFIICIYFVTDFGISLGLDAKTAAFSVSIFGIGTTIGRASAGAVASIPSFKPALVTSVSLVIAGIFMICTVLLCSSFLSLALCFGLTGFFVAPIIPLTTVILADYLGMDHLTNAHGLVSLGKGLSSLISAPLAGVLQDIFGSYVGPFCITGSLFIISGLLHSLLVILPHKTC